MTREPEVLILWADDSSPNLGVRALARGTEALVRGVWPHARVTFQNYGSRIPQLPIGSLRALFFDRMFGRRGMQDWFRGFDLIVDTRSGDSFSDIYGLHRLAIMTTVGSFAAQAGVPVVLGPQTIGPFESARGRALGRATLRSASLVLARDPASARVAGALGGTPPTETTDVVFALPVPRVERTRDVLLNVSGLLWHPNPYVDHRAYRRTVDDLHSRLVSGGRRVAVLAHVIDSAAADNDARVGREFAGAVDAEEYILPRSLDDVREAVASADLVIGSRMHACLNAISVGTAAIPLAYSDKFTPLLAELGWNHAVDLRSAVDPVRETLDHAESVTAGEVAALRERARVSLLSGERALASVVLRGASS
jgi:polysaccharide pyruvyl transferase WcaK-like protein